MFTRIAISSLVLLAIQGFPSGASAQTWSAEQQEVWQVEQQQWKMAAAKDASWTETMVHANLSWWEWGQPAPSSKASLKRWYQFGTANSTVIEQELFPLAITITGNVAVVHYLYQSGEETNKKERETITGRYTDILIKENGRWLFLAWTGGEDPKN